MRFFFLCCFFRLKRHLGGVFLNYFDYFHPRISWGNGIQFDLRIVSWVETQLPLRALLVREGCLPLKKKQRILMDNKLLNILVAVYEGAIDIRLEF